MSLKRREPVSKIMTKQPLSVNISQGLEDVHEMMNEHCIRHVPVVSGDDMVGILSKTDLERVSFVETSGDRNQVRKRFYDSFSIEQIMTKNVQSIQLEDSVKDAAEMLSFGNFHALPVLEGKKLVGIVTTTDVINYLLEQY